MDLLLIKLVISIVAVLALTYIAEKYGPKTGGIAAALPIGTAIILFFVALDQGTTFAAQSALYNIAGMTAVQVFLVLYYYTATIVPRYKFATASICATVGFFVTIILFRMFVPSALIGILIPIITTPLMYLLLRHIPKTTIAKRAPYTPTTMAFRVIVSTLLILGIAGLAPFVGPELLGLLSSFPTTLFPVLIIIAVTYGIEHTYTIAKNFPLGHFSIYLYSLAVFISYPIIGAVLGTFFAYIVAAAYLVLFWALRKRIKHM